MRGVSQGIGVLDEGPRRARERGGFGGGNAACSPITLGSLVKIFSVFISGCPEMMLLNRLLLLLCTKNTFIFHCTKYHLKGEVLCRLCLCYILIVYLYNFVLIFSHLLFLNPTCTCIFVLAMLFLHFIFFIPIFQSYVYVV